MDSEPHWAQIISYLYRSETGRVPAPVYQWNEDPPGINDEHSFVTELGLSRQEAAKALFHATDNGFLELIFTPKSDSPENIDGENLEFDMFRATHPRRSHSLQKYALVLSRKGFEIAHEREMNIQRRKHEDIQRNLNKLVAAFTLLLGFSVALQVAIEVVELDSLFNQLILFAGIALMFMGSYRVLTAPDEWFLQG